MKVTAPTAEQERFCRGLNRKLGPYGAHATPCLETDGERDAETTTHVLELSFGPHRRTLRQPYPFFDEDEVVTIVRKWIHGHQPDELAMIGADPMEDELIKALAELDRTPFDMSDL